MKLKGGIRSDRLVPTCRPSVTTQPQTGSGGPRLSAGTQFSKGRGSQFSPPPCRKGCRMSRPGQFHEFLRVVRPGGPPGGISWLWSHVHRIKPAWLGGGPPCDRHSTGGSRRVRWLRLPLLSLATLARQDAWKRYRRRSGNARLTRPREHPDEGWSGCRRPCETARCEAGRCAGSVREPGSSRVHSRAVMTARNPCRSSLQ